MTKIKKIEEIQESRENINVFFEKGGGKWPKEKRFLQVIEEVGELSEAILEENQEKKEEELGDIIFTYIGYMEPLKPICFKSKKEIIRILNSKNNKSIELLLLEFISVVSLENKIFRKNEKRRNENREIELNSDVKIELNRYKSLILLNYLIENINPKYDFLSLVNKTIDKYTTRGD